MLQPSLYLHPLSLVQGGGGRGYTGREGRCVCVLCVIVDVRMCVVWVYTCIHAPVAQACIYDDTPNCYLGGKDRPHLFFK